MKRELWQSADFPIWLLSRHPLLCVLYKLTWHHLLWHLVMRFLWWSCLGDIFRKGRQWCVTLPSTMSPAVAKVNIGHVGFCSTAAYVPVQECPHCKLTWQTPLPFTHSLWSPFQICYLETSSAFAHLPIWTFITQWSQKLMFTTTSQTYLSSAYLALVSEIS